MHEFGVGDILITLGIDHVIDLFERAHIPRLGRAEINERIIMHIAHDMDIAFLIHIHGRVIVAIPAQKTRHFLIAPRRPLMLAVRHAHLTIGIVIYDKLMLIALDHLRPNTVASPMEIDGLNFAREVQLFISQPVSLLSKYIRGKGQRTKQ